MPSAPEIGYTCCTVWEIEVSYKLKAEHFAKAYCHICCVDFPNSDHGMSKDPDKIEEFNKAVMSYCDKYMP